jgi:hypothetical protein
VGRVGRGVPGAALIDAGEELKLSGYEHRL